LRRSSARQLDLGNSCDFKSTYIYATHNAAMHKGVLPMILAIERFFDSLFAPLAREVGRMPLSALRHMLVTGL